MPSQALRSFLFFFFRRNFQNSRVLSTNAHLETRYLEYLNEPTRSQVETEKRQRSLSLSLAGYFRVIALSFIPFAKSRSADTISRRAQCYSTSHEWYRVIGH